jgi:hypothetical protein
MVLLPDHPTLVSKGNEVIPVLRVALSQITDQVQPLASGTFTVRVAKSDVKVAVMF